MRWIRALALTGAASLLLAAPSAARGGGADTTSDAGWTRVAAPLPAQCSDGSPYSFWVHEGDPARVAVFLNGGGACWSAATCDPRGRPTYTMRADSANDPRQRGEPPGILAVDDARDPLGGYTMVFVSYCTGDVHLGARDVDYGGANGAAGRRVVVHHQGRANLAAALAWADAHAPHPEVVVVAGSSAGAIASPLAALAMARRHPDARIVQLGDGAGGYHSTAVPGLLAGWGATTALRGDPAFAQADSAGLTFEALYLGAHVAAPQIRFAEYDAAEDEVQRRFLTLIGTPAACLAPLLREDRATLRVGIPDFRAYTAPGTVHTILRAPAFYTLAVDGVPFREWMARRLRGEAEPDVGDSLLAP